MIYMVFIIIIFLILITVMSTMNAQHGKISERPLRRKILDDTANLLFFATVFFCLFFFVEKFKIVLSLIGILLITLLFRYKTDIKKTINNFLIKSFLARLQNKQKVTSPNSNQSPSPNPSSQQKDIYREYILSFIILFCKRAVLLIVFSLLMIWIIHNFFNAKKIMDILEQFCNQNFLMDALTLLNNWGLIFNCWNFNSDYHAIQKEDHNEELERIIRKLDRREHDI